MLDTNEIAAATEHRGCDEGAGVLSGHSGTPALENHTMMNVESIESSEPLHLAILELGRRYEAGEISRECRDARLVELNKRRPASRRRRARVLSLTIPAPITFYSLDEAHA